MEVGKLTAQIRTGTGKSTARKIRGQGQIPAICYGAGVTPLALSLDPAALMKALDPAKGQNTLFHLRVEGQQGGPAELPVMLKDSQRDALRGNLTHVDFVRVQMDKDVRATVPLVLTGKPEGVKAGGTLHQVFRTLVLLCHPGKIPSKVEVDITGLGLNHGMHISDLKLPEGVKPVLPPTATICTVTAPKEEKAAAAAEGAEGAEAAPAEGAKKVEAKKPEAKKDDKAAKAPAGGAKAAPKAAAKGK